MSFGKWLQRRRKALGLTQQQLARRVSCATITLRKVESEERHPSARLVGRLATTLGIPSAEKGAFLRFARGDSGAAVADRTEPVPWSGPIVSRRQGLPAVPTSLIGREQTIADVKQYLTKPDVALLTLIGPPGVGKTRLAIESARAIADGFADGVVFVALAPLDDPSLVALTTARALGYSGGEGASADEELKDAIADQQLLVVLDNCEHVIARIAALVHVLLSGCPRLKLLATSRESLRVGGECQFHVPALELPRKNSGRRSEATSPCPALVLFRERARAVRPDFELDETNFEAVSDLCVHVDGLPLAIELIAARTRLLSPATLLARLSTEFVTQDAPRDAATRQRSLHDSIAWSYNLLSNEEQRLLAFVSVFAHGFSLEAAEAMFSPYLSGRSVRELIASLLDKSLLQRIAGRGSSTESVYTMLATIKEFARGRLRSLGEETAIRDRHLASVLETAEVANSRARGAADLEWLDRIEAIGEEVRAALDWAISSSQAEQALRLARNLHWYWFVRGDHSEGRQWLANALALPEAPAYPESYAEALTQAAHHTWVQQGSGVWPYVLQALSVARERGDSHNLARALVQRGLMLVTEGDFDGGRAALEESLGLFEGVRDKWGHAHAIISLAFGAFRQKDLPRALALHEAALAEFRGVGERYFEVVALRYIGVLHARQGRVALGMSVLRESLILGRKLESKYEIACVLYWCGEAALLAGRPDYAACLYWAARNAFESVGSWKRTEDEFRADLARCQNALDESSFAKAAAHGRAMSIEQAVAFVLGGPGEILVGVNEGPSTEW